VDRIQESGYRRVGLVGLSFKTGTDDLRESPLVTLAETLIGKGFDVRIYDPDVRLGHLIGTNRAYIEQAIPHIGGLMADSLRDVVTHADVLVIGKPIPECKTLETLTGDEVPELVLDIARTQIRVPVAAERAVAK
jgi:GDP-mannose 6-dehydrogenase